MASVQRSIWERLPIWRDKYLNLWRIRQLATKVARQEKPTPGEKPVIFFNASTRLEYMSQNGAFSLLSAWGVRMSGTPVIHFVCQRGMSRCVLSSTERNYFEDMPCDKCVNLSEAAFAQAQVQSFTYSQDAALADALEGLNVDQLADFGYQGMAYGQIVLPSVRWCKRRHHLQDDDTTRTLFTEFILSAYHIRREFQALLDRSEPQAVVVFNGLMFPEAIAKLAAQERGIPVVMHEVGYQPFSGFFSTGEATAREVEVGDDFQLNDAQEARLQNYLSQRFSGSFTMAGIQFWPEMSQLDERFLEKAAGFKQIVPIFTNVIFDTSQPHANVVYEHMFAWLDDLLTVIQAHPETLFVLRAHPDEMRTGKASHETVKQWVQNNRVDELENVVFIHSEEFISSYELIGRSKFMVVYNSSIGLEGALLGKAVLCGGEAWYARFPTVFFPKTPAGFRQKIEELLNAEEIVVPEVFQTNARRLLYYQNYQAALPFDEYLGKHSLRGFVRFKSFKVEDLLPSNAPAIASILKGIKEKERVFTISEENLG
ncbi:MAG TPA: hypothetical protein VLA32_09750 [Anaerolineales bacterium]|nr:hypothetical protein [Anaerolineales bacterium]